MGLIPRIERPVKSSSVKSSPAKNLESEYHNILNLSGKVLHQSLHLELAK